MNKQKARIESIAYSLLNSYSMVFFSKNHVFAGILLLVSFFDPLAGLSGLISIITANTTAYLIGLNRQSILSGMYGFNSLLVGLGIGVYFSFSPEFLILVVFSAILTLFLTLLFEGVIGKYGLPYLTLSFLFTFWLVMLAARRYSGLSLSERGIFTYNEFYAWGGLYLLGAHNWLNELSLPLALSTYFKSLSAIFFQYHLFPGILIALGLFYYSRIAFSLSLLGFYSAYLFYHFIGADLNELNYSFIGFNFILTSIAIGGFFIISSPLSYLWVVLLTPVISILLSSSAEFLAYFQLSTYSFPFNIVVLIFLYMLRFREKPDKKLEAVLFQEFSPERNLYSQQNSKSRFLGNQYFAINLPFMGEWIITQGHEGEHTHKEAWKHAWDFEIADDNGKTYDSKGNVLSDYYCFNKPVIAPYDGWIEEITDNVEDNEPHRFDLQNNWGNTIVMRHADGLYSKLSHLRKGSIKIEKGAFVKKGDLLALCGNSGRSPQPHVHFQLQTTPYIGSHTLDYPIGRYILHQKDGYELVNWGKPETGQKISNIELNACLKAAFHFIPGQQLSFTVTETNKDPYEIQWYVGIDLYNYTYLHCTATGSKAYFRNDHDLHFFTWFQGDRNSLLYDFYLGAYKIAKGFYPGLIVKDEFPLFIMRRGPKKVLQDLVAPFFLFVHSDFELHYVSMNDELGQTGITLHSSLIERTSLRQRTIAEFRLFADHNKLESFTVIKGGKTIVANPVNVL